MRTVGPVHACETSRRDTQEIHALRTRARLTQGQLAARIGTSVSAISRLEDADYNGHSMNMLVRITAALNRHGRTHLSIFNLGATQALTAQVRQHIVTFMRTLFI